MGFKAPKNLYRLVFAEDTGLTGLEVNMRSIPMGVILEARGMTGDVNATLKDPAALNKVIDIFVGALDSWNLEDDDDKPIPADRDGVMGQDPNFIMQLVEAWTTAIAGVAAPLDARSTSGPSLPEGSIPMETLSPSLLN